MGKENRKGQLGQNHHLHHKAGEGNQHHKFHDGPMHKQRMKKNHATSNNNKDKDAEHDDEALLDSVLGSTRTLSDQYDFEMKYNDDEDELLEQLLEEFDVKVPPEVLNAKPEKKDNENNLERKKPMSSSIEDQDFDDHLAPIYLADLDEVLNAPPIVNQVENPLSESRGKGEPKNTNASVRKTAPTTDTAFEPVVAVEQTGDLVYIEDGLCLPSSSSASKSSKLQPSNTPLVPFQWRVTKLPKEELETKTATSNTLVNTENPAKLSTLSYPTAPKLTTAARSKEREQRAKYFKKVAERTQKDREIQSKKTQKYKHAEALAKSMRPSLITVPNEPFQLESTRRYELTQQKLEEMRKQRRDTEEQRATAELFRAKELNAKVLAPPTKRKPKKSKSTVCHPFTLRSASLHQEIAARRQMAKLQAEEKSQTKFVSRPAPKTTYQPNNISTHELDTVWSRRYHKSRREEMERLQRMEQKNTNVSSVFKHRPVPKSTYTESPSLVSSRLEDSLRRVKILRQLRLEKVKQLEEAKKREELEGQQRDFHSRKVPVTTYRSPTKPGRIEQSLLQSSAQRSLQRAGEIGRRSHEETHHLFRARPLPKTTFEPSPISVRDVHLVDELRAHHNLDQAEDQKESYEFHALPIPKSTYHPDAIAPSSTRTRKPASPSKVRVARVFSNRVKTIKNEDSINTQNDESQQFYAPYRNSDANSASSSISTSRSNRSRVILKEPQATFQARPMPQSTYEPFWVTPKKSSSAKMATEPGSPSMASVERPRSVPLLNQSSRLLQETISSKARKSPCDGSASIALTRNAGTAPVLGHSRLLQETVSSRARRTRSDGIVSNHSSSMSVASDGTIHSAPLPSHKLQRQNATSQAKTRKSLSRSSGANISSNMSVSSAGTVRSAPDRPSRLFQEKASSTLSKSGFASVASGVKAKSVVKPSFGDRGKDSSYRITAKMAGDALRRKAMELKQQKKQTSTQKLAFTPVVASKSSQLSAKTGTVGPSPPRKLPSPRKLNATSNAKQPTFYSPDKSNDSYTYSRESAFEREKSLEITASSVVVGSIPTTGDNSMDNDDEAQKLADLLDSDPSAEITFNEAGDEDEDACELAAILDEGPDGEITAEISFGVGDEPDEDDLELAAILNGTDEHYAELAAILDF